MIDNGVIVSLGTRKILRTTSFLGEIRRGQSPLEVAEGELSTGAGTT
jgi:hypothetical protein